MKQNTYIIIAIVIIVAVAGGYYFMQKNQQNMVQPTNMNNQMATPSEGAMKPDGDTHTLTWADNGKHLYLEPEDKLVLSLDDGTAATWTTKLSDPMVFSDASATGMPAHAAGMFTAEKLGEETITATNNMTGAKAKTFTVTIRVVKDDNDPNLPKY